MTPAGFPHSEIHGSTLASSSPWHFAGSRVLHRLLTPRHPPCALGSLTSRPPDSLSELVGSLGTAVPVCVWVVEPEVPLGTSVLAAFCALSCLLTRPSRGELERRTVSIACSSYSLVRELSPLSRRPRGFGSACVREFLEMSWRIPGSNR